MIEYKHAKEKEILLHYAQLLSNDAVKKFLQSGCIDGPTEVKQIAQFYWQMVDKSVEEDAIGEGKYDDMDTWLERIYTSLHIYFNNIGFGDVWDSEVP